MLYLINKRILLLCLIIIAAIYSGKTQSNLIPDGNPHTVFYNGNNQVQEFKIPNDISQGRIYLETFGGDGGAKSNKDDDKVKAKGGQGAQMGAWFEIGTGANKIPPGATVLFIIGEKGDNAALAGSGAGGGGGGSGLFFQESNGQWTLLVVAGGGQGGAGSKNDGLPGETFGCVNKLSDHRGQDVHCVVQGPYSSVFSCGTGGGALFDGVGQKYYPPDSDKPSSCSSCTAGKRGWPGANNIPTNNVKPTGGQGGSCGGDKWIGGGFGFGGGEAGKVYSTTPASGGGFTSGTGTGGGSYINPNMKMTQYFETRVRHSSTEDPQHGKAIYQIIPDPKAVCNDLTLEIKGPGNLVVPVVDLAKNSYTTLLGEPLSFTTPTGLENGTILLFNCGNVGTHQYDITVEGLVTGYTSECTSNVTVVSPNPVVKCRDITVNTDENGSLTLQPEQVLDEYLTFCGPSESAMLSLDKNNFTYDCAEGGPKTETVILNADDGVGNTSSCTSTVTINVGDNSKQTLSCRNIEVTTDEFGNAPLDPKQLMESYSNACGSLEPHTLSVGYTYLKYNCAEGGPVIETVGLHAQSEHLGIWSHCNSQVTVNFPEFNHKIKCYDIEVSAKSDGTLSINPSWILRDYINPCGAQNPTKLWLDEDFFTFTCEEGNSASRSVVLTAENENGETVSCSSMVTVNLDHLGELPASCKPAAVQVNPGETITLPASALDNNSSLLCDKNSYQFGESNLKLQVHTDGFNGDLSWSITSVDGNTVFAERPSYPHKRTSFGLNSYETDFLENIQLPPGCYRFNWTDSHGDGFWCVGNDIGFYRLTDVDGNVLAYGECSAIGSGQNTEFCVTADTYKDVMTFDCSNPGVYRVGLIAIAENGSTSSCQTTITVNGGPTAICQPVTVQIDNEGQASLSATDLDGGSFSDCGNIVSYQLGGSQINLTIQSDGANEDISWTITSLDGSQIFAQNSSYGDGFEFLESINIPAGCYMFNWMDSKGDGFACPGNSDRFYRLMDAEGNLLATGSCQHIGSGASRKFCVEANSFVKALSFDCSDSGQQAAILTVTDEAGNTASCQSTITIESGAIKPIECVSAPVVVQLNENGQVSPNPEQFLAGGPTACSITSLSLDQSDFDCNTLGTRTIILNATHIDGSSSSCEAQIQVRENVPPTPVCKDVTVQLDDKGSLTLDASVFDNGSTDNCGISDLYFSDYSSSKTFVCSDVGVYQLYDIIVEDYNSNLAYCSVTFTLEDKTPPVVLTQDVTIQLDVSGMGTISTNDIDNGSNDACGIKELILDKSEFSYNDLGQNKVFLTVTDNNNNTASQEATVTVQENLAPTALCQNVTVQLDENGNGSTSASAIDNGSHDGSGIKELSLDLTDFNCNHIGDNPVVLTVTDNAGNSSTCEAMVKVVDELAPDAICKTTLVVQLDENGEATFRAQELDNGSTDNCGSLTFEFSNGSTEKLVTCTTGGIDQDLFVKDNKGNTSSCGTTIIVEDNIPPVAVCKDVTIEFPAEGGDYVELEVLNIDVENSYDNCEIGPILIRLLAGDCSMISVSPIPFSSSISDVSGNVSTCTSLVTVVDRTAPEARCKNVTIQLDENGEGTISAAQIDNGSSDACGIAEMTLDKTTISCSDNSVTMTVKDNNGNVSSCTATVITLDEIPPVPDLTDLPDIAAECSATVTAPTATDNCGGTIMASTNDPLSYSSQGTHIITWSFDDGNGNIHTQTQTVIIKDVSNPVPDQASLPIVKGECSVSVSAAPTATDNCEGIITGTTSDPLTYSTLGTHTLTWTFDDGNGNVATQTQTVIVEDVTKPVPDLATLPTVTGECSATVSTTPTAKDNCSGQTIMGTTSDPLTYSTQGTHTITWSFDDGNGNVATQTQTVIVDDVTKPVPDQNSLPILSAECSVTVSQTPTATDNCAGTIIGTTTDPLSYSSQGTHIITWSFDDGNGNVSTQTQTVIIKDVTAPVPDVATLPTITGNCEVGLEPPFATDNCAGQILGSTSDPLYFDKEGTYTVTWIYDDGNGNTSSQDQTIIIEDDVAPVPDRNNLPTLRAQCGLTVSAKPTATDRCVGTVVGTTSDPLTYNTQGIHIITWTFADGNGNTVTQTQRVVIRDNKAPIPDQASLPALTGSCSVMITHFPTATDNCVGSVTATTDSPLEFDQEGTFAILWNYDDGNGNISTQTQWVIVGGNVAPNALCKNISMPLTGNGSVNINPSDIDNGSFDDCSSVTLLISPAGGSIFGTALPPASSMDLYCKDGKEQSLLLSVTNEKGNTASCQAKVTLEGTDSDSDGLLDSCDNCPDTYNLNQKDSNNNGTGDACEEDSNPDPNPGGWGGWSLKKQGKEEFNTITELKAFPNPFQEDLNLKFNLNQEERTTIEIFNIQGQRVHTLLSELAPKGEHRVLWDGKDQSGQSLPSGVYMIRLRAGKALINQKVILQR